MDDRYVTHLPSLTPMQVQVPSRRLSFVLPRCLLHRVSLSLVSSHRDVDLPLLQTRPAPDDYSDAQTPGLVAVLTAALGKWGAWGALTTISFL